MNPLGYRQLRRFFSRSLIAALAVAILALPTSTLSDIDADLFLFTTSVPPNVVIMLDNSGSMNHLVWHPAYDPQASYDCSEFDNEETYYFTSSDNETYCDNDRTIYHDTSSVGATMVSGHYLNWLFSDASDAYVSDIDDNRNGTRACSGPGSPTFAKYQRNRLSAAKQVVLDTICRVEATKAVRFGLAVFREPNDADDTDPNGGYLEVGIDDSTPAHAADLEASIANSKADTSTPLAETLFQVYTYFMGRDAGEQGPGATDGTTFPIYQYSRSPSDGGGKFDDGGPPNQPDDPIDFSCQKNFVILITDGEPTRDDFDSDPDSTAMGFDDIADLVGNYDGDAEVEIPGNDSEQGFYLDDLAKLMNEKDFRPDLDGEQTIDTYTIGFTTQGAANDLLRSTAEHGNGIFFESNSAEELTEAIVKAITDIIEKSQSFTAATVPSTRTAAGGDFYTSFFLPTAKSAFWQGHLRAFGIDASGNIFDKDGNCPLVDLDAGECNSGAFVPGVEPFWDAGQEVPVAGSRKLYTTKLSGIVTNRVNFDNATLTYADLTLSAFDADPDPAPNLTYPGSAAKNAEGLSEEIISYVRGCEFATGVSGTNVDATATCITRGWRLGDIFHSAPVVVGQPNAAMGEVAYSAYAATHKTRRRVIYAGANDGFLHAFDAGTWNAAATPPTYTRGSGAEIFGFMPWESRKVVKNLPIDDPTARHYYVDGSPQAADVWIHPAATTNVKAASGNEYRTRVFGGLRQGGRSYYSIDVTDPSSASYPVHVWDFPAETDPDDTSVATSILPYLGEAWSQPILTRVRVAVDGNNNGGYGFERWVMVITGGYHVNGDPNDFANYDSSAIEGRAILIVDVKSGELLAMKKFTTSGPASDPQRDMKYAIPSTPAIYDLDFDGFADLIMVGDLGGQVWKWVITAIGEDRVNDSSSAGDYSQPSWPLKKFFETPVTRISGDDYYKSIFYPPGAAYQGKDLWYSFGTGERNNIRLEGIDGDDENNRIYAIRDRDPYEVASPVLATLAEGDLTDLSSTESCTSIATPGYYFKLADGEKVVTNVEIFAGFVLTGTFTPANTGDPCTSKGLGNLYVFDVECGGGHYTDAFGNPTRAVFMGEGMPTDPQVSVGVDGKDNIIFVEKSGADLESLQAPNIPAGAKTLLYWREIH